MNLITSRPADMSFEDYQRTRREQNKSVKSRLKHGTVIFSQRYPFQGNVKQELILGNVKKFGEENRVKMQSKSYTSLCRTVVYRKAPRLQKDVPLKTDHQI